MQKTFSQSGMGLLQVMLIGAALAAGGLVVSQALNNQKLAQKSSETRDELEVLHTSVVSALQDSAHCTQTHLYNSSLPATGEKEIKLSSNETLIREGQTYMNGSIRVDEITTAEGNPGSITVTYSRLKQNEKLKKGFGAKDIKKNLPVQFIQESGTFSRCYLDENQYNSKTAEEFCGSLGAFLTWDPGAKRCALASHVCSDPGTIFTGISAQGTAICQPLEELLASSDLFDLNVVNCPNRTSLSLSIVNNKIRINCNSANEEDPTDTPTDDPTNPTNTPTLIPGGGNSNGCHNSCMAAGFICQHSQLGYGAVSIQKCNGGVLYCAHGPPSNNGGQGISYMCPQQQGGGGGMND